MVETRSQSKARKQRQRNSAKRSKTSPCRNKGPAVCRSLKGCKYASGKKRNYCRRSKNLRKSRKNNNKNLVALGKPKNTQKPTTTKTTKTTKTTTTTTTTKPMKPTQDREEFSQKLGLAPRKVLANWRYGTK